MAPKRGGKSKGKKTPSSSSSQQRSSSSSTAQTPQHYQQYPGYPSQYSTPSSTSTQGQQYSATQGQSQPGTHQPCPAAQTAYPAQNYDPQQYTAAVEQQQVYDQYYGQHHAQQQAQQYYQQQQQPQQTQEQVRPQRISPYPLPYSPFPFPMAGGAAMTAQQAQEVRRRNERELRRLGYESSRRQEDSEVEEGGGN